MKMTITILRHGKTDANRTHAYSGRYNDISLSDEGIALARELGENPEVSRVYVTPLVRTHQTARLLFPAAEQIVVDGLAEMDFGDFENRTYKDMADDPAYQAWVDSNCETRCPNGETRSEFTERSCAAFDELVEAAALRDEQEVIIVAHGGTLMSVMGEWARPAQPYWEWITNGCCGYRFDIESDSWASDHTMCSIEHMIGHTPAPKPDVWHDPSNEPEE